MNDTLVTRKEAARQMSISECTISRCVNLGAPVHRRGTTGHRYLVNVSDFIKWMEAQSRKKVQEKQEIKVIDLTVTQMAARRHEMLQSLRSE